MNFEKKKQLLDFLSTDDWAPALNQKYKNFNPKDDFFAFQEKLNSVFMEFKEEFQVNELLENSNIYISRLIYDLNTCINSLNSYLENEMNFYSNSGFQYDITAIEAIAIIKENEKYELSFVESMMKKQIDLASDVIDYVNTNNINVASKSIENNKIIGEVATNQKSSLPYQRAVFKGKKIDLIMMFLSYQSAGVIEFKTRRDLELFLEHNFKFVHGKQENDITAVGTEISELYNSTKEPIDKIKIKTNNEKRNSFFEKLQNKVKQVNLLSENGATPWD